MNHTNCLNCEQPVNQTQQFCANCGQSTNTHRFTLKHFFHEGFHAFTHADKGLIYLLKELILRPGVVAREYIAGKRKKYFNPFTFFLILMAMFVVSSNFNAARTKEIQPTSARQEIKKPAVGETERLITERRIQAKTFMSSKANFVAMIAIPFFALYFSLIYYRKKYNYSEHLVASLMFIGVANLAFSVIVYPLQVLLKGTHFVPLVPLLGFLLQLLYLSMAYSRFLELKGFWANVKVTFASLLGLILWVALSMMAISLYVYQNAHFLESFNSAGGR